MAKLRVESVMRLNAKDANSQRDAKKSLCLPLRIPLRPLR